MQFTRIMHSARKYRCEVQGAREKGYLPIPQQQLLINVLQQAPVGRNYQNYKLIRKIKSTKNNNRSGLQNRTQGAERDRVDMLREQKPTVQFIKYK